MAQFSWHIQLTIKQAIRLKKTLKTYVFKKLIEAKVKKN